MTQGLHSLPFLPQRSQCYHFDILVLSFGRPPPRVKQFSVWGTILTHCVLLSSLSSLAGSPIASDPPVLSNHNTGVCSDDITLVFSHSPPARHLGEFQVFLTRNKAAINTRVQTRARRQGLSRAGVGNVQCLSHIRLRNHLFWPRQPPKRLKIPQTTAGCFLSPSFSMAHNDGGQIQTALGRQKVPSPLLQGKQQEVNTLG